MDFVSTLLSVIKTNAVPDDAMTLSNRGGGVGYALPPDVIFRRFLILGTDSNTYYASAEEMTYDALRHIIYWLRFNVRDAVREIVDVSKHRRAPRNIHAVRMLAVATYFARTEEERQAILEAVPVVIWHGGELLEYVTVLEALGSWGRFKRRAVTTWLRTKNPRDLSYTALKYTQRRGMAMRDVLRLAHPRPENEAVRLVYRWMVNQPDYETVQAHAETVGAEATSVWIADLWLRQAKSEDDVVRVLRENRLSHEFVPNQWYSSAKVWKELVRTMPVLALLRALPVITNARGLDRESLEIIERKLTSNVSRIHPIRWFYASNTYESGVGKGSMWTPDARLVNILKRCTQAAFEQFRRVTDKKVLVAIDSSGSMSTHVFARVPAFELALMMAYTIAPTKAGDVIFYSTTTKVMPKWGTFGEYKDKADWFIGGGTDMSLPFMYANGKGYDAVVVFTDNETWAGSGYDVGEYITKVFRPSNQTTKVVICAVTATHYSAAPEDSLVLNIAGFDTSVPSLVESFVYDQPDAPADEEE